MLKQLYQLQGLETAERALDEERLNSEEFKQLRLLKASFEKEKLSYQTLNVAIARLEAKLAPSAGKIAELQGRIEEEKQAVYAGGVTNAKELQARESQAAALERKLDTVETESQLWRQQLLQHQEEAGKIRAALTDKQAEFVRVREQYQQAQNRRDEQKAQLEVKRQELKPQIPDEDLAWFESLREKFAGTPVAQLDERQVCSGCHTMVPPVTYKRTVAGQRTCCEKCGRTLFVDN